jgi:ABC-type branched-subunit amino acid transport system ATPase component
MDIKLGIQLTTVIEGYQLYISLTCKRNLDLGEIRKPCYQREFKKKREKKKKTKAILLFKTLPSKPKST